jgi:protein involved in polysaccharide export with SLBB domain
MRYTAMPIPLRLVCALVAMAGCGATIPGVEYIEPSALGELPPLEAIPSDPNLQSYTMRGGSPSYVLGAGDRIEIRLRDVTVTTETVPVRSDGNISFSLVENVKAAGLTVVELDSSLTVELSRFFREPKVDIEVVEFHSQTVSILGAIESTNAAGGGTIASGQGRYPLKKRTTVLDLILEAGGTTPDAQLDLVRLVRGGKTYHLDIQRVLNTGEKTHNVVLQGEDIIIVPGTALRSRKVIVLGEVASTGVYMFSEGVRLVEALSQAGGLTSAAQRDDIRVIRVIDGQPSMFRLDFNRIISGDLRQNVSLQTEDVVYVPRSFLGDVNDVIARIDPLLSILLLPATYRDLYTTGGGLRVDTGDAESSGSVFTRSLPGTSAGKAVTPGREEEEKRPSDEAKGADDRQ